MKIPTEIEDVLIEYDCTPYSHTRRDESGQLYYCQWLDCHWYNTINRHDIYSITPIDNKTLSKMKSGKVDLREVILSPSTRIFAENKTDELLEGSILDYENVVPKAGVTLRKE